MRVLFAGFGDPQVSGLGDAFLDPRESNVGTRVERACDRFVEATLDVERRIREDTRLSEPCAPALDVESRGGELAVRRERGPDEVGFEACIKRFGSQMSLVGSAFDP